jgi:GNAT superfamily N-acetyltransferase
MPSVCAEAFKLLPALLDAANSRSRVCRLGREHEADLAKLLKQLDRPSRISRFGQAASDACIEAYAKRALATAAFMAGVFVEDALVGVVEVFDAGSDGMAEIAFAVDADWRRLGFGTALLATAAQWARCSRVRILRMVISRNNWPMRHLAAKAGARLDLALDEIHADVAVPSDSSNTF